VGIYRLLSGRHRRFEDGVLTAYTAGDLIDLNEDESKRLQYRIKPVGRAPAAVVPPCPDPEPEALSAPVTPELPDVDEATDPEEIADPDPDDGDPSPEPETVGGTPVFTAPDTPNHTVTELKKVVANIGEPSLLQDMAEAEERGKGRRTVLHMLETKYRQLVEDEDDRED
jgi:hypothetical protein